MTKIRLALKTLSDDSLLHQTQAIVAEERRISVEVLWHLIEIERRLLHAQRGFSSLHSYMTEQLRYTPAAAQRRIQAMRLLVDMPEAETSLQNGELSVTTMSQLQYHVKKTAPSLEEKRMLLEIFKGKSERECEKIVAGRDPESLPRERARVLTGQHVEIRFVAGEELQAKLRKVQELLSHAIQDGSYAELFLKMADRLLQGVEPKAKRQSAPTPAAKEETREGEGTEKFGSGVGQLESIAFSSAPVPESPRSRYIPIKVRRSVVERDRRQCTYMDAQSGRRCTSRWKLEIDHSLPFAKGGATETDNLRVLCKLHNQLAAVREFGREKMGRHIPRLAP